MAERAVLILEDMDLNVELYRAVFASSGVDLLVADNVAEATLLFDEHQEHVAAVIVDYRVRGKEAGDSLVHYIREQGYQGFVIGASSEESHNKILEHAGCDESDRLKYYAARKAQMML